MSNNSALPEILDGLEYESQFIQRTQGAGRREVKLNRGDSWLLRFLPVKIGPKKRWYARIAKHFGGVGVVVCPRQTEEAYGGDPNAYCPVCELSEHLNTDRSEEVSQFGFKLRATPQWTTYCVVFEKSSNGGAPNVMPLSEILLPYTFQHYNPTWLELTNFVKQGARRSAGSVLDLETGNDFFVSKGAKNGQMRLDKQDSGPIFPLDDPKWDENIAKIYSLCKEPVIRIPSEQKLDEFAEKARESAAKFVKPAGRGAVRRPAQDSDDIPPDDDAVEPPPARSRTSVVREEPVEEAQAPEPPPRRSAQPAVQAAAEPPPRRSAQPAPQVSRRSAPPEPPPVDDDPMPEDAPSDEPVQEAQPEPPPARAARPSSRGSAPAAEAPPAPGRRQAAPTPPPPARQAPRGGALANESIDEEEAIPEEANDQAPPEPLVDPSDDIGAGDPPPAVEPARRGATLGTNIKDRIAAVSNSARK